MGLFDREPTVRLPPNIIVMMERFGRHEIDVIGSRDDASEVFRVTQRPLIPLATSDPRGLIAALAEACIPAGGLAVYGADRTVVSLIGSSPNSPDWPRILDASIAFLRSQFVPPMRVAGYAWNRFIELGGTSNTWIALREPPSRQQASITPMADGEARIIIKMARAPDANVIFVRREGMDYVAFIDARWNDEDPTRSQSEWKRASDLYDLYLDVAWSTQVWHRADPELEPFFPAPKARI